MVTLTLLDVDRWPLADTLALAAVLSIFNVQLAVVVTNGSMCIRIAADLVDLFLTIVTRDVLPVRLA